jgi:rare lipoprotein A
MLRRLVPLLVVLLLAAAGCARKKRVHAPPAPPQPAPEVRVGDEEAGIASWYGHPYHGRRASNGEIYDMEKLTAAHRTLPFGTVVLVRNLDNERSVEVRIIDRGPFIDGRIIDLSRAAARQVAMLGPGTAQVRLRIVALPPAVPAGYFAVQIGAFRERANAERERARLETRYGTARLALRDGNPPLWRVLVGHAGTAGDAAAFAALVRAELGPAFVVRVEAGETD